MPLLPNGVYSSGPTYTSAAGPPMDFSAVVASRRYRIYRMDPTICAMAVTSVTTVASSCREALGISASRVHTTSTMVQMTLMILIQKQMQKQM